MMKKMMKMMTKKMRRKMKRSEANKRAEITVHELIPYVLSPIA